MKVDFPIIAIGASAGGLEPLELFFEQAKPDSPFAYILIQHLAPNHKSLMDELLSRHTALPIRIIAHDMPLEKGTIYLNPPKMFVSLREGKFSLHEKEDRRLSFPISSFFSSLALHQHEQACAIVLSGTGSDGSEGVKHIKEKGGLVLVQDPESSKFDGMPKNAINTGAIDKVCHVAQMHEELEAYFSNKEMLVGAELESDNTKSVIANILDSILKQTQVDFTGYKYTTVSRRISRRMSLLGYSAMTDYLSNLEKNPTEAHMLSRELLIGVTRFFRDEEAFEALRNKVIPRLLEKNRDTKSLRIWVAACSTGEEAYSIAILIKDYLRLHRLQYDVSIFATDLDKQAIKLAANRVFPENISSEIPPEYLSTYFIPHRSGYTIAKEIREMIVFSAHNLIQDPPFNKIDMLCCRNFLIYLNDRVQQQLFSIFQYALKDQGILFLGSSESLGKSLDEFIEFDKVNKIFLNRENKKFIQQVRSPKTRSLTSNGPSPQINKPTQMPAAGRNKLINDIQHTLIQAYVPDSVVTDQDFNLIHTTGNANLWLQLPSGEVSSNVMKMLPESLAVPLEVVANKVIQSGKPITLDNVAVGSELNSYFNDHKSIKVTVRKAPLKEKTDYLLITFESDSSLDGPGETTSIDMGTASIEKIAILERELRVNKETLQTTIEELESSNEELQAANEELQSSNEELESVNEELYTVNAEYQQKNQELLEANNDLSNLIHSTEIALLFLDTHLNIRKFTPEIKKIMNLMPHDIGRNISHFRGKIQLEDFMDRIEEVYSSLVPFQAEIKDNKENEYLLKISPFKTPKNEIQGVILVFVDISRSNTIQRALAVSDQNLADLQERHASQKEIFEVITKNLRDLVTIISPDGEIAYCSPSAYDITGFRLEDMHGMNFLAQVADPRQREHWRRAIEGLTKNQDPGLLHFKFKTANGTLRWMESNLNLLEYSNGKQPRILITTRDIHQRKLDEIEKYKLALIAEQTGNAVLITDTAGKITFANNAFEKMTGYQAFETIGLIPGRFLQGEESEPEIIKIMSEAIRKIQPFDVELINYTKFGSKYIVRIQAEPMYDYDKQFIGFFSIQTDVTHQKNQFEEIHKLNLKIKEQNTKLEEVNTALEEFAYVASHDLKTPVRNIRGLLDIIQKKGEQLARDKRDHYFHIIYNASGELNKMIDNLLEYSRTGTSQEIWEQVSLPKLVKDVISQFGKELESSGGKIRMDLQVDQLQVYPILFKRLLTNLIGNALKYRQAAPPEIKISCQKSDSETVIFQVADNGLGIPEDQFDNIFKIFKSLNPNKDSNGIGLSVSKKIVELHGGRIWLASKLGEGTTFFFEIKNQA
ncbi:two-component system, chemotaxis family, CheB/CheR fusion protein [Cyclobacterium lianum]|uniref:histidine kinase n=1 Tax=Cyclobacterium lianum TaxID=388280 RepID=A0A1M7JIS0_9BACT|nr:CheR family methyltransferase [Cyclobacterium lianum]SHM52397.1 two-component system, chemotaxis family, CheB/CheR fusion protein [Cyclobacterium lianum]